jgi:hypothetical protein
VNRDLSDAFSAAEQLVDPPWQEKVGKQQRQAEKRAERANAPRDTLPIARPAAKQLAAKSAVQPAAQPAVPAATAKPAPQSPVQPAVAPPAPWAAAHGKPQIRMSVAAWGSSAPGFCDAHPELKPLEILEREQEEARAEETRRVTELSPAGAAALTITYQAYKQGIPGVANAMTRRAPDVSGAAGQHNLGDAQAGAKAALEARTVPLRPRARSPEHEVRDLEERAAAEAFRQQPAAPKASHVTAPVVTRGGISLRQFTVDWCRIFGLTLG